MLWVNHAEQQVLSEWITVGLGLWLGLCPCFCFFWCHCCFCLNFLFLPNSVGTFFTFHLGLGLDQFLMPHKIPLALLSNLTGSHCHWASLLLPFFWHGGSASLRSLLAGELRRRSSCACIHNLGTLRVTALRRTLSQLMSNEIEIVRRSQ